MNETKQAQMRKFLEDNMKENDLQANLMEELYELMTDGDAMDAETIEELSEYAQKSIKRLNITAEYFAKLRKLDPPEWEAKISFFSGVADGFRQALKQWDVIEAE